jgi:hypothetical protein
MEIININLNNKQYDNNLYKIKKLMYTNYIYYFIIMLYIKHTKKLQKIINTQKKKIIKLENKIYNDENDEMSYDFIKNIIYTFTKYLYNFL